MAKKQIAVPEDQLPEGYSVVEAPPAAAAASGGGEPQASPAAQDLPAGYAVQGPGETPSVLPFTIDQFKKGVAGSMSLPALATDVAAAGVEGATKIGQRLGELSAGARKLIGLPESPQAKEARENWFKEREAKAKEENVGGIKQATRGLEALLRIDQVAKGTPEKMFKDVEIPKDSFGGTSKANEYIGKIANFVGSSIIPGAGPVVEAERKLLTATTQTLGNVMSGMSAVEIKQIAGQLAPSVGLTKEQGEQMGEQWGGIMGPGLVQAAGQGIAKASQTVVSGANKAGVTGFSEAAQKAQAEVLLHKEIINAVKSNPTSEANLAELIDLQKKMADFKPGAAQATGSPALIAMTRQVSQSSPEALAKAAAVDARNQAAISKFKEQSFPSTKLPVNEAARAKYGADQGIIQADLDKVDRQLTSLSDQYTRSVDKQAIGQELRDLYWAKKGEVKGKLDKQIEDVYRSADEVGLKADMTGIRDTVRRIVADDKEAFQQMPGTWGKILKEFGGAETVKAPVQSRGSFMGIRREGIQPPVQAQQASTEVSFEKLHSLYKEANREWMDMVAAQKPDMARKLDIVRSKLREQVDQFQGPQYGQVGEKFAAFNQDYTKYSKTFKEGAGGEVAKLTRKGYSRDAEDIVDKVFLKSGDKSKGLEDFFQVYGRDERAARLLKDGLIDNFSRAAVDSNGNFSAVAARNWMKRNDRALDQLPNVKAELQGTTDISGSLINRRRELEAQRKILDKGVMAAVAKNQKPELLVEAGMNDPRLFKALVSSAKTQEAKESIARSIVDMTAAKADSFQFLTQNEKVLKPVMDALGKEHWNNLKAIAKAEEIAGRSKAPSTVELSKIQDPAEQLVGTSGKGLLQRMMAVHQGRAGTPWTVADVAGRMMYKVKTEEMARLREAALFDPEVSALLSKVVQEKKLTSRDLLDLKAIGFQHGISIGSQALQVQLRGDSPEERAKPKADPNEGEGLWRRKKSSLLY
jgi:hypothetical protein